MDTLFDAASELLFQTLSAVSGERGRYGREGMGETEVSAIRGRKDEEGQLIEPITVLDDQAEWIFRTQDLILDGEFITPEEEDTWTVFRDDGTTVEYQVLRPSEAERCWSSSDHNEILIRVYMQRQTTEETPV